MSVKRLFCPPGLAPKNREAHWSDGLSLGLPENFNYSIIRTPGDAFKLITAIPSSQRGVAAKNLYMRRNIVGKRVAYRGLISAWDHDHTTLVSAFGSSRSFISALREVAPPRPKRRRPIRAWRGGNSLAAAYGISWTPDRDIACWFSIYSSQRNGTPFVFYCDIPPESVIAEYTERGERELIIDPAQFDSVCVYLDDGSEEGFETFACDISSHEDISSAVVTGWQEGAQRFSAVCKAKTDRLRAGWSLDR